MVGYTTNEFYDIVISNFTTYITGSAVLTGLLIFTLILLVLVKSGFPLQIILVLMIPLTLTYIAYGLLGTLGVGVSLIIFLIIAVVGGAVMFK